MADIDRHELHTLVDHIPESDMPAARKVLRVGESRWNWRFWPRPWTTSRRRRKSEAGWRRLWPRNLPTSRLNSSGANRHEASPVPPPRRRGNWKSYRTATGTRWRRRSSGLAKPAGDVKMLTGEGRELRLRVGHWRVRFIYEKPDIIRILHIRNRREAYLPCRAGWAKRQIPNPGSALAHCNRDPGTHIGSMARQRGISGVEGHMGAGSAVMGHDLSPLHSHDILRCVRHIPL